MALQGGHRFTVSMDEAFSYGLYALGVEQAMDYDEKTGRQSPSKDKHTGQLVWTVTCIDRDPEVRGSREVKIKVLGPHMPALPPEIAPNSGIRPVEFSDLVVTPYVQDGGPGRRSRLALSFRATGVYPVGKAPREPRPADGKVA